MEAKISAFFYKLHSRFRREEREFKMLDIKLFRVNPEIVRKSQRRRFANIELVDEVIALDEQGRKRKNFPSL